MEALSDQDLAAAQNLIAAIARQAHRDADVLIGFLRDIGVQRQLPDGTFEPLTLPPEQLLGIGLAIRLRSWEINHITLHLASGIPHSSAVFDRVVNEHPGPELSAFVTQANLKALSLYTRHFVWSGRDCDLHVDLAMVMENDEAFLDGIVEFLCSDHQLPEPYLKAKP